MRKGWWGREKGSLAPLAWNDMSGLYLRSRFDIYIVYLSVASENWICLCDYRKVTYPSCPSIPAITSYLSSFRISVLWDWKLHLCSPWRVNLRCSLCMLLEYQHCHFCYDSKEVILSFAVISSTLKWDSNSQVGYDELIIVNEICLVSQWAFKENKILRKLQMYSIWFSFIHSHMLYDWLKKCTFGQSQNSPWFPVSNLKILLYHSGVTLCK